MSQDSDFKSKPPQSDNDKRSAPESIFPKRKSSHLALVVSNPAPVQEVPVSPQLVSSNTGFTAHVKKRGANLYEMNIQDPFHDFGCDLILEIEARDGDTIAICHFPTILDESNKFLDEDETLYGTIAIQFQMKVLEQLFLFCASHDASQLTIYIDDDQAEGFGIYQDFLAHCDEAITKNGEKTEMVIPTDQETFDKWRNFMAATNLKFEQDLWRGQQFNPAIRRYLKARAHG